MRVPIVILAGVAVCSFQALGQSGSMSFPARISYPPTQVTGAPYSAERVVDSVRIAADGTRFVIQTLHARVYRDSEGRMRSERLTLRQDARADEIEYVEIRDPVANVGYVLDPQGKVAHRLALERQPSHAAASSLTREQISVEDLGREVVEGLIAEGHRTTRTWQAGTAGSDRAFQDVTEAWYSPDVCEIVLAKYADPRSGDFTEKLFHISRGEPDTSVFVPPSDYSVVDETENFQVHWTVPRP